MQGSVAVHFAHTLSPPNDFSWALSKQIATRGVDQVCSRRWFGCAVPLLSPWQVITMYIRHALLDGTLSCNRHEELGPWNCALKIPTMLYRCSSCGYFFIQTHIYFLPLFFFPPYPPPSVLTLKREADLLFYYGMPLLSEGSMCRDYHFSWTTPCLSTPLLGFLGIANE